MSTTNTAGNPGKFRLDSADEFSKRAKRLATFLELPLQRAQNLLARIYGFRDFHDLRSDAERPAGDFGPYDEDLYEKFYSPDAEIRKGAYRNSLPIPVLREQFILELGRRLINAEPQAH